MSRPEVPRGAVTAADGLLVLDKPAGLTSHDLVALTRRMAATRKVGHAGTLDPMATGVLILGIGRATRFLTYLVGADKTYEATVRLGQETLTEDADGEVTASRGCSAPGHPGSPLDGLDGALAALTGDIEQVPSAVSAIKVDGVRSYARVRGGEDVELPARPVTIRALVLLGEPRPAVAEDGIAVVDLDLRVTCSSGTYVRALARDLGRALGCGGHLTALRRTAVGPFTLDDARALEAVTAEVVDGATAAERGEDPSGLATTPLEEVARRCFDAVALTEAETRALGYGQPLPAELLDRAERLDAPVIPKHLRGADGAQEAREVVAGFAPDGGLVALLTRKGSRARPLLVLAPAQACAGRA